MVGKGGEWERAQRASQDSILPRDEMRSRGSVAI